MPYKLVYTNISNFLNAHFIIVMQVYKIKYNIIIIIFFKVKILNY